MLKATREEIAIAPSNVKMRENVIYLPPVFVARFNMLNLMTEV